MNRVWAAQRSPEMQEGEGASEADAPGRHSRFRTPVKSGALPSLVRRMSGGTCGRGR